MIARIQPLFELLKYGQSRVTLSGIVRFFAVVGVAGGEEDGWFKDFSGLPAWPALSAACAANKFSSDLFRLDSEAQYRLVRCVICRLKLHGLSFFL